MKRYMMVSCLLVLALSVGCAAPRVPLNPATEPTAIVVPNYYPTIVEVREAIFSAVNEADWSARDRAPGLIYATKKNLGSTVTLEVDYSATSYFIKYSDSTDSKYSKDSGNVPKSFMAWAKDLQKYIDAELGRIGSPESHANIVPFPRIAPSLPGEPTVLIAEPQPREKRRRIGADDAIETRFETEDKATVTVGKGEKSSPVPTVATVPSPAVVSPAPVEENREVLTSPTPSTASAPSESPSDMAAQPQVLNDSGTNSALTPLPTSPTASPASTGQGAPALDSVTPAASPTVTYVTGNKREPAQPMEAEKALPHATDGAKNTAVTAQEPVKAPAPVVPAPPKESTEKPKVTYVVKENAETPNPAAPTSPSSAPSPENTAQESMNPKVTHAVPVQLVMPESTVVKNEQE